MRTEILEPTMSLTIQAMYAAQLLQHSQVGTEHVLIAYALANGGLSVRPGEVLTPGSVINRVIENHPADDSPSSIGTPFTPRLRRLVDGLDKLDHPAEPWELMKAILLDREGRACIVLRRLTNLPVAVLCRHLDIHRLAPT